jgi:hypothetical protein
VDARHWPPLFSVHCPRLIICVALTPYPQYTAVNNIIVCTHWETPLLWLMVVLSHDMGVIILIIFVICFVFTANFTRYNNFNFSNINAIFMLLPSLHYIFFLQKLFIMLTKFKTHPLILFLTREENIFYLPLSVTPVSFPGEEPFLPGCSLCYKKPIRVKM